MLVFPLVTDVCVYSNLYKALDKWFRLRGRDVTRQWTFRVALWPFQCFQRRRERKEKRHVDKDTTKEWRAIGREPGVTLVWLSVVSSTLENWTHTATSNHFAVISFLIQKVFTVDYNADESAESYYASSRWADVSQVTVYLYCCKSTLCYICTT